MGEIADLMVNGDICQACAVTEGEGLGFPFTCRDCLSEMTEKIKCLQCDRLIKPVGMAQHIAAKHSD